MKKRIRRKLIHEGRYIAEVEVEVLTTDHDWSPYLSQVDAYKLDDVRESLRRGDIASATAHGKVYTLSPVTA